ncbi:hypothetical protein SAMN05661080_00130 [Modestobacter sp. DSM 44400]|nr:hypothetical protein [Modestobacter sp. DSM 44400]SDX48744.1 hypothetical protein SAMN05661080_00130 [Modestobacter sp. DSM 44400]
MTLDLSAVDLTTEVVRTERLVLARSGPRTSMRCSLPARTR